MTAKTGNLNTDENNALVNDSLNRVAKRVVVSEFLGNITALPSGLQNDYLITTFQITDVASLVPFSTRNSISIRNYSLTETIYIGKSDVTADLVVGTTSGWQIGPNETINLDCKETIEFYAIARVGVTILAQAFEVY